METIEIKDGRTRLIVDFENKTVVQEFGEKWEPKDGDFCANEVGSTFIYKKNIDFKSCLCYAWINKHSSSTLANICATDFPIRQATNTERKQLLDALAKDGKAWDAEKKEIVKLRWRAEDGEPYYFVSFNTEFASVISHREAKTQYDAIRYKLGNYYQTKEQATSVADRINAIFAENL